MKKVKKIKRDENEKSVSKKRAKILIISALAAIVLLIALNSIDYDALADKIIDGNSQQKEEAITFPDHYYETPVFDEDITKDGEYMDLDRYVYLKIGGETNQLVGTNYEKGTMERFWIDYFAAVTGADSETLNSLHTDHFASQNGKYGKFAPQKLYKINVEITRSTLIEEGKYSGCYQHFATVNYKIYENNGTFRRDIVSDETREQIVELIEGRSGIKIHTVSYARENIPTDEKTGASFMIFVWIVLIIFSVVVELLTVSLVAIWFMPAGLIALVLSLFKVHIAIQIVAYLLSAALFIVLFKTVLKKKILSKKEQIDAEKAIGVIATVTERIDPTEDTGKVSANGKVWFARMTDGGPAEEGDTVTVVRFEGDTLYCERDHNQNQ